MPKLGMDSDERLKSGAGYRYSGTKLKHLAQSGNTEQTLFTLLCDVSSSVSGFRDQLEACVRAALRGLKEWGRKSGRENAIQACFVTFSTNVVEVHGFRLLTEIDPDSPEYEIRPGGTTAMYEATATRLDVTAAEAKRQADAGFTVNAETFVIGDGLEYPGSSSWPLAKVKERLKALEGHEELDSHLGVLVGVNTKGNDDVKRFLAQFKDEAGWDVQKNVEDALAPGGMDELIELAVSSVSSMSQGVGSGAKSLDI